MNLGWTFPLTRTILPSGGRQYGSLLSVQTEMLFCSLYSWFNGSEYCFRQNGTLRIIDRKKHIFKLAQGEYISPEKIENIYIRSEPVAQLYVHGDSLQVSVWCSNITSAHLALWHTCVYAKCFLLLLDCVRSRVWLESSFPIPRFFLHGLRRKASRDASKNSAIIK